MSTRTIAIKSASGDASRGWPGRSKHKRGCRRKERREGKRLMEDAPAKIRRFEGVLWFF